MARLAFFTPWPPQPSGVATCSADVVAALAASGHAVDVFVDEALVRVRRQPDAGPEPGAVRVQSAHDFVWRQARGQYDLPIYQMGNARAHGFVWPYLFQYPGLVVLHDARLHHARADALLARRRADDYRAEFAHNHPGVSPDAAELAIHGLDGAYYYHWPMRRSVVDASRLVATHSAGVVRMLRQEHPGRPVAHIALGHGVAAADAATARPAFRARHGIPHDAVVFGVLGTAAPEKRVVQIMRAFAGIQGWARDARLLFAGDVASTLRIQELIAAHGLGDVTHLAGRLDDAGFDHAIVACDVGLNLRWPTALEVSGPWLRMLSAGRPTIVVQALHHVDVVTLDPRTWRCPLPRPALDPDPEAHAVAVGIDILDEDHSLRLALRRLATDADLRQRLGAAARAYWESNHSVAAMASGYEHAIAQAASLGPPALDLPAHLRPDPEEQVRSLVSGMVDAAIL